MTFIKLYNYKPKIGEYVNFVFTEHKDNYLCCKLTDYALDSIMTFQCLTSKKKIKSLKSMAPLNKEMIGIIENIDDDNIELNLVNVNKNSTEYGNFVKLNQDNHTLRKYLNQYTHKYNKNLESVLNENIYTLKVGESYLNQINNFCDNNFCDNNLCDNDFYNFVKTNLKGIIKKANEYIFNIVCYNDINDIIKLFDETLEQSKSNNINIYQSKLSEYTVSSNDSLEIFTILLKNNILKYNDLRLCKITRGIES